jgi:biotin carboxyl carrier protein
MAQKPPPRPLHVVPSDREVEEDLDQTTVAPLVIDDDDVVVVTSTKRLASGVSADLQADPDVQDALRWLDPPSNTSLDHPVAPPAMVPMPDGMAPHYPVPVPGQYATPLPGRYATPLPGYPTPMPGSYPPPAGYYATPVPGHYPTPMHYPLPEGYHTPMPAPMPAERGRSPLLWILVTAFVTGGGVALGWFLFGRGRVPEPAPAPVAVVAPPVEEKAAPPEPVTPPPAPEPAPPAPIKVVVSELVQAGTSTVAAPSAGQVKKVLVEGRSRVAVGDKLIEIALQDSDNPRAKKLAKRVSELERLSARDPVYTEFLADARREYEAARGRSKKEVVRASSAGMARALVNRGDPVAAGDPIVEIASGGDWTAKATAAGAAADWRCSIAIGADKTAPCAIEAVVGAAVTVRVGEKDAPWLDGAQKPELRLDPP